MDKMKKILAVMFSLFALVGCVQDDLEEVIGIENPVQTRAVSSSLSDFNQVDELVGLPLNVIHLTTSENKYLSCESSGNRVYLAKGDDGSGRQRWYLANGLNFDSKGPSLTIKKGNNMCNTGGHVILGAQPSVTPQQPILEKVNTNMLDPVFMRSFGNRFFEYEDDLYLDWRVQTNAAVGLISYSLQPVSDNSENLKYLEATYPNESAQWTIVPVGDYKVVDVQYEKVASAGDYIIPEAVYCGGTVVNDSPNTVTRSFSISETIETTSTFTESSKVSTQNQSSFGWSLGAEVSLVHIGFDGEINNSIVNEQSVSYQTTEQKSTTITDSYTVEFAPHFPCRLEILKMTYIASLTYVLTLEKVGGESNGKRFRIKGKWSGKVLSDLYFTTYSLSDDSEMESALIPEGANTIKVGY